MKIETVTQMLLSIAVSVICTISARASVQDKTTKHQSPVLISQEDSLSLVRINMKMDSIRAVRPTVGLVLSGGGAKGAAHVGVIRFLEEKGIPVDLVVGTSMGGLIGGLYSMGYNAEKMDSILRNVNWPDLMLDHTPRKFTPYNEIRYREQFLISFPFHYENSDSIRSIPAERSNRDGRFKERLLSIIPSGYIYGHNVDNVIKGLSIGYHDSLSFSRLPRPYACVATDLVTAKGKIWYSGSLPVAMRSTMSIPGVFSPVWTDGMVLVDGGMRNNYPADLARDMGADILIGVDLNKGYEDYSGIKNLVNIANASVSIMGREVYEKNCTIPDITIRPVLREYDMMSFDSQSIATIISRGYEAASIKAEELDGIKERLGESTSKEISKLPVPMDRKLTISSIHIDGVTEKEERTLLNKLPKHSCHELSRLEIEDMEAQLIGTGGFENISYKLLHAEEGYNLMIDCNKAPVHKFGLGIRFDTEEMLTAKAEAGFNVNKISGSRHRVGLKLSANPELYYLYSYDSPKTPTFNAGINVGWTDMRLLDFTHGKRTNLNYLHSEQKFFLSNMKWKYLDMQLGISNDLWWFPEGKATENEIPGSTYCTKHNWTDYPNLFFQMRTYTFDDGYFPTRGIDGGISYKWTCSRWPSHDEDVLENFHAVRADIKGALSLGERITILPSAELSLLMGKHMPLVYGNFLGGAIRGRYIDQQIPFPGINGMISALPYLGVFTADFRVNVYKAHYLTGHIGYMRQSERIKEWFSKTEDHWGVVLDYAYNSPVGPLSLNIHWSDLSPSKNKFGFYINMGFYF